MKLTFDNIPTILKQRKLPSFTKPARLIATLAVESSQEDTSGNDCIYEIEVEGSILPSSYLRNTSMFAAFLLRQPSVRAHFPSVHARIVGDSVLCIFSQEKTETTFLRTLVNKLKAKKSATFALANVPKSYRTRLSIVNRRVLRELRGSVSVKNLTGKRTGKKLLRWEHLG